MKDKVQGVMKGRLKGAMKDKVQGVMKDKLKDVKLKKIGVENSAWQESGSKKRLKKKADQQVQ